MRTSPQQFKTLIAFMELHGDLSKPVFNARGRVRSIHKWDNLTSLLNDGSGDTKTTEKWKKVWSDFKNNAKKKAIRISKAMNGDGHVYSKLNDLEQRVLNLIGFEIPTGPTVQGIDLPLVGDVHSESIKSEVIDIEIEKQEVLDDEPLKQPSPSHEPHVELSPPPHTPEHIFPELHEEDHDIIEGMEDNLSPVPSPVVTHIEQLPSRVGHTTARRRRRLDRRYPRRPRHSMSPNTELSTHFLSTEWREFRMQQHRENMEMRREENRVREMEVQAQSEWQRRVLDILDKLVTKFIGDSSKS